MLLSYEGKKPANYLILLPVFAKPIALWVPEYAAVMVLLSVGNGTG
ncbi:MAG: hypothetical protein H7Z72_11650 [Bacteroidetes bacterium]|nr:hypothetical protein [Fibrella sp.]